MKKWLFLFLVSDVLNFTAQTYFPFPDSNGVWSYIQGAPEYGSWFIINKGDTILNSKIYQKYYQTSDSIFASTSLHYQGSLRQDISNRKIFGVSGWNTAEVLMYDFNLNVNDTITVGGYFQMKVFQIDSVMVASQYRKRIWLNSMNSNNSISGVNWIEGIGSDFGPLNPAMSIVFDLGNPVLLCQKVNITLIYQSNASWPCYYPRTVGISEKQLISKFTIYPNPTNNFVNIITSAQGNFIFKIEDLSGREIEATEVKGGMEKQLDMEIYQPGIFILTISQNGRVIDRQKLVILK